MGVSAKGGYELVIRDLKLFEEGLEGGSRIFALTQYDGTGQYMSIGESAPIGLMTAPATLTRIASQPQESVDDLPAGAEG